MAATMPECMLQNIAQPQRNPASGENVSRRNTYTPPVCGNADASSAQTSAPNSVSTPHDEPDEHDLARRVEVTRDLGRLDEDRRADDRAGDHRDRVEEREGGTEAGHVRRDDLTGAREHGRIFRKEDTEHTEDTENAENAETASLSPRRRSARWSLNARVPLFALERRPARRRAERVTPAGFGRTPAHDRPWPAARSAGRARVLSA